MYQASESAAFTDDLHTRRTAVAGEMSGALSALGASVAPGGRAHLAHASKLLDDAVAALADAEDELRRQNDAYVAATTELDASAAVYRDLFDSAPAAFVVTTPDARVTHANRAASMLLLRPMNALVGRELASFVSLDEQPVFRVALARSRDSRFIEEWPIRFAPTGGPSVDCRVRTTATRSRTGTLVALSWIITDALGDVFD